MYLKNDKIVATLGNVVMRSYKTAVGDQFILDPTAVVGWTDGTAVRRDATPRATYSGDFSEVGKMSARIISFSGTAVATSRPHLQAMRDKFVGLLVRGDYEKLQVQTSVDTRFATVGLEGTTSWVQLSDTVASWKIDLYAPDPYIYGEDRIVQITSSTINLTQGGLKYPIAYPITYNQNVSVYDQTIKNNGNAEMWPLFKILGDFYSGFTLTDSQVGKVTYRGAVTMESPVVIDMGKGTAMQDGIDKSEFLTDRKWFSISPSETIRPNFLPLQHGAGWCDIIARDTWI